MPGKGATEVVPDRLDAWYAAERDAKAGVTIADDIVKQTGGLSISFTKTAVGIKKRLPSGFELLVTGGDKPWMSKNV